MAKKKEDNRDIFEKVLDAAPIAGGAIIGGLVGRKAGKLAGKKFRKADVAEGEADMRRWGVRPGMSQEEASAAIKRHGKEWADRRESYYKAQLGLSGGFAGAVAGYKARESAKSGRRK